MISAGVRHGQSVSAVFFGGGAIVFFLNACSGQLNDQIRAENAGRSFKGLGTTAQAGVFGGIKEFCRF